MKPQHLNYIIIAGLILLFVTGNFFVQYYMNHQKEMCLSSPFVYGAKQLTESTGYEFVGEGRYLVPIGKKSEILIFNSTSMHVQDSRGIYNINGE